MSLPPQSVDAIFTKLALVYGHRFLSIWDGLPIEQVKADWAFELAAYAQRPEAIAFALRNLPAGRPPDVFEFRDICRRMPETTGMPKLPPPRGRMELRPEIRAAVARLLEPPQKGEEPYRVVIARRFLARWEGQEHLSPQQRSDMVHFRRVVEKWEASCEAEAKAAAAKAAAQQAVDQFEQHKAEGGHVC